jgi:DNA topoisomerase-1
MRTDSTYVAESAQAEAREVIARYFGEPYLPERPPFYRSRAKVAQEAHEAIRPTSSQRTPKALREVLPDEQARLYELIWRRFIASQMKPAVYNVTTVDIACSRDGQDLPHLFRATGRELLFAGFLRVYQVAEERSSDEEGSSEQQLPLLEDGDPLLLHGLYPEQHFTKPPAHFTEASLIKELEQLGIGRPSTYATILRTIQQRDYVSRQRKSLRATPLGTVVCDFLLPVFPDLFAVDFTAQMEEALDSVARGERSWVEVLKEFHKPFAGELELAQVRAASAPIRAPGRTSSRPGGVAPTGEECPECGSAVVIRDGKYGRFRSCTNFPRCRWAAPLGVGVNCPRCGAELVERKGKRGVFWGCSKYPECRFTRQPRQDEAGPESQAG